MRFRSTPSFFIFSEKMHAWFCIKKREAITEMHFPFLFVWFVNLHKILQNHPVADSPDNRPCPYAQRRS